MERKTVLQEPLGSLLGDLGKSQGRFLALVALFLNLQGRDGESRVSCPNDHTLVIVQDCDHLRG